ncbi:hypothetical protein GY45DRAFT_124528 [Cubamyces sp. BRFM 1775]|nr:hypothetical protein GY45DRAFT_124528 [Cubamyces sp. BRFM 1775]
MRPGAISGICVSLRSIFEETMTRPDRHCDRFSASFPKRSMRSLSANEPTYDGRQSAEAGIANREVRLCRASQYHQTSRATQWNLLSRSCRGRNIPCTGRMFMLRHLGRNLAMLKFQLGAALFGSNLSCQLTAPVAASCSSSTPQELCIRTIRGALARVLCEEPNGSPESHRLRAQIRCKRHESLLRTADGVNE